MLMASVVTGFLNGKNKFRCVPMKGSRAGGPNTLVMTVTAILLLLFIIQGGDSRPDQRVPSRPPQQSVHSLPSFASSARRKVIGQVGTPAYLSCHIHNLGNRAVSWVRSSDLKILTVGTFTYTSDHRFTAVHAKHSEEWLLKITNPQKADSGTYQCQVSVEPKMSQPFYLEVVESRAVLDGPRELFLRRGSNINLTCTVVNAPEPPDHVHWYLNNMIIKYTERGGISIETNRRARKSNLVVTKSTIHDSGNYSCRPSMAYIDTVAVHILDGEHPAAMQHGNSNIRCDLSLLQRTLIAVLLQTLR